MELKNILNINKSIENNNSNFIEKFIKDLTKHLSQLEKNKDIYYIVDRFEDNFAICENSITKEIVQIPRNYIDSNVKESDFIKLENDLYKTDYKKTLEKSKDITQKYNSLLK